MAEHNAIKYGTALSAWAKWAVGLADDQPGLSRVGETLQPVVDPWKLPEWSWLRRERLYSRSVPVVNGVGFSTAEFVNPATSNVIAVIDAIVNMDSTLSHAINWVVNSGPATGNGLVGTVQGVDRDTRDPQLGETSVCTIVRSNNLGAGAVLPQRTLPVGAQDNTQGWIIVPGKSLFIAGTVAAANIQFDIAFRERKAFPGELGGA